MKWRYGARSVGGKIFALPYMAIGILEVDPASGSVASSGDLGNGLGKWANGVVSTNGAIYGIPDAAGFVLKFDPSTGKTSKLGSLGGTVRKWTEGILTLGGSIYALPSTSLVVLKIDTNFDTVEVLSIPGIASEWQPTAAPAEEMHTQKPTFAPPIAFCVDVACGDGAALRAHAENLVCRELPCDSTCCVQTCGGQFSCSNGVTLVAPIAFLLSAAMVCALRQAIRCKHERLEGERFFKVTYFTLMFLWDVCDQSASWWFWQYTTTVGASTGVQTACLVSALLGILALVGAFVAGLFLKTRILTDHKLPEFAYSIVASVADIIMLFAMFFFEMEGLDEGSLAKVLNLVTTIIDFALKILQAAWAYCGSEPGSHRGWDALE